MDRLEHLEHLDKHLVDELAQEARETVREELREQTRRQRRTALLYAGSGAVALYAGAALALTLGLALALGLPDWAAALITAVILGVVAYALREAARPKAAGGAGTRQPDTGREGLGGGQAAGAPTSGSGKPYPPMPPVAPDGADGATAAPGAGTPAPGASPAAAPRPAALDPDEPHHRA
jgi:hypothetical protein